MKIKIGTRKSKLAVAQTNMTAEKIREAFPDIEFEIVYISTMGDLVIDKPIADIGGRGIFVAEIEQALLDKTIDIAVHSAKDLPAKLGEGLDILGVLERGNYRDVLVTNANKSVGTDSVCTIGTGSLRRRKNLKKLYTNAEFENIRGNVDTRLNKLYSGQYDGIVLAAAGLERLGVIGDERFDFKVFDYEDFLPAPCQGIIAVEGRKNDFTAEIIKALNDMDTYRSFEAERFIGSCLNADCGMPLGAYTFTENGKFTVSLSADGEKTVVKTGDINDSLRIAKEAVSCL